MNYCSDRFAACGFYRWVCSDGLRAVTKRKVGMKWLSWLVLAVVWFAFPAMAQISGTNAVALLEDNVTNATTVAWPIVIGIIGALVALSVFMKVGRKGGVRA